MKKNTILKITNPILIILVITQALSAVLHGNISYEIFQFMHKGGGVLLLVLIALHIVLNFRWFKSNFLPKQQPAK